MNTWDETASTFQGYLAAKISLMPLVYERLLESLAEGERLKQVSLLPTARLELYHLRLYKRIQYRNTLYTTTQRRLIY